MYLQLPPEENNRSRMIRNVIKHLERELEGENDKRKLGVLRIEIEELKRKLGEIE